MTRLRGGELVAAMEVLAGLHGTDVITLAADPAKAVRRGKLRMPHQGEREKARRLRQLARLRVPKGEK